MTLSLLVDLQGDIDTACDYLLPLWDLLANYRVDYDHAALALEIDRDHGVAVGDRYREAVERWTALKQRFSARNCPH